MMTAINGVMLAAGSSLAALIVVKVTVVAALGLAAAWLARRSRAAVRHALLAVTFGATLLLPIASIVAPPVHVTVPVAEVSRAAWPLVVEHYRADPANYDRRRWRSCGTGSSATIVDFPCPFYCLRDGSSGQRFFWCR